jgi:hypothetical protein
MAPQCVTAGRTTACLRPEYSGHYFAAFVIEPDGNNVEAVFHKPSPLGRDLDDSGQRPA